MWNAVAEYLVERFEEPVVVFDREGTVLALNTALEKLVERPRNELLGRSWSEICPPGKETEQVMACLSGGLDNIGRKIEVPIRKPDNELLNLVMNISHLGGDTSRATVGTVIAARPYKAVKLPHVECSQYYEITAQPGARGSLTYVWANDDISANDVGRPCYEAFYKRSEPCLQCPAFQQNAREGEVRTGVVRFGEEGDRFGMVTAEFTEQRVRVSVRHISRHEVSSLVRARVDLLAEDGGLSSREHSVLGLLIAGKSADDIGEALGISPRTAKFHQTNILQKLGVDSRLELFRLVVE